MENEPKPEPELDEPLEIEEPSPIFRIPQRRFTETGRLWAFAPWLLILRKKLRCTLLEFIVFTLALGSSLGSIVAGLSRIQFPLGFTFFCAVCIIYGHLWGLAKALYNQRRGTEISKYLPNGFYVALHLALPTFGCNYLGYYILNMK